MVCQHPPTDFELCPKSWTVKIRDDAFQNAINLKMVTGMQDVRTLGESGVFAYAYNLTHVDMPNVSSETLKGVCFLHP